MQTPVIAIAMAAALSGAGAASRDDGAEPRGLIVASNVYLRKTPVDSPATLMAAMRRLQQPQDIRSFADGAWRVHFAAVLERAPGETTLELRFDSMPGQGSVESPARVFSTTVPVDPAGTTVFVNDFVISNEMGFSAGSKYEVSLWRAGAADAGALAKGSFLLE
jgi:hypothetical protein